VRDFLIKFFASGFFVSYIPAKITGFKKFTGSGMAGTIVAFLIFYFLPAAFTHSKLMFGVFVAISFPLSVWIAGRAEEIFQKKDDPRIVIDEILGYWTAVLFVPFALPELLTAFVLFRILDTLKPWPIHSMEIKFRGGMGVMLDDIVGGAEAGLLALLASKFIFPLF
jgi:phosphatidylglycerophosphatase A